jgi:hypothetical protein
MTGQQQETMKVETERSGGSYNEISSELVSGTENDLSSAVFRERGDVISKDQFNALRFEFLVNEFPELVRELVVQ